MSAAPRTGRPRASSRETIADAACELFLEQGYEATAISDIARRAGVSRSSFFNYFASKADVLWGGLDERIDVLADRWRPVDPGTAARTGGDGDDVRSGLLALADGFAPDSLALALQHATAMGLDAELEREASVRRARLARLVVSRLDGADPLRAEIAGAAHGGAVLAAISAWAAEGAGRRMLAVPLAAALDVAASTLPGPVRQLRVVVRAEDLDTALVFYRDRLGLTVQEAYQGEGDARVVILGAGRATLELSNPAQIELIDAVETDGDAPSERIRLAFEVADAQKSTRDLVAAGAALEASARLTPWGSRNSRLRGPADLQMTLFEEGAAD